MTQLQNKTGDRRRLAPLTSWRFFAAALVVFHHCGKAAFQTSPEWFQCFIQNGYQAVSFFFVLSGFILVYTYHQAERPSGIRRTVGEFLVARIARIYPTYLLALCIALPAFLYYAFLKKTIPPWSFALGLVTVPVLLQAWLPLVGGAWNGPAWALSVEAFFYCSFPHLARRLALKSPRWWFWGSLGLVITVHLTRHYAFPLPESGAGPYEPTLAHHFFAYFPLFHLPTFLFGMALGKAYLSLPAGGHLRFQNLILLSCLGTLIGLFVNHGRIAPVLLSDAILVPIYGALVFTSATAVGILNRILSHAWLVALGEASYCIYILHIPLVWWATRLRSFIPAFDGKNDFAFFWCYFAVLAGVCLLVFEYYEQPLRRWTFTYLTSKYIRKAKPGHQAFSGIPNATQS